MKHGSLFGIFRTFSTKAPDSIFTQKKQMFSGGACAVRTNLVASRPPAQAAHITTVLPSLVVAPGSAPRPRSHRQTCGKHQNRNQKQYPGDGREKKAGSLPLLSDSE